MYISVNDAAAKFNISKRRVAAIGDDILSTMWREVNDHEE